jgi:hypothetical protein
MAPGATGAVKSVPNCSISEPGTPAESEGHIEIRISAKPEFLKHHYSRVG